MSKIKILGDFNYLNKTEQNEVDNVISIISKLRKLRINYYFCGNYSFNTICSIVWIYFLGIVIRRVLRVSN